MGKIFLANNLNERYVAEPEIPAENPVRRPGQLAEKDGYKLCLWSQRIVSPKDMRKEVLEALGPALEGSLVKIKRVRSLKKGSVRWDITCKEGQHVLCLESLQKVSRYNRWYVREHIPYHRRMNGALSGEMPSSKETGMARDQLKVVSLNINGFSGKKAELGLLCLDTEVDVLLLQETKWKNQGWQLKFPGYSITGTEMGDNGEARRGVAVAVKNGVVALDAEAKNDFVIFVKVLAGRKMFLIGSVYVPSGRERQGALKDIFGCVAQVQTRYPHIPLLLGGDWNMTKVALKKWLAKKNIPLACVEFSGSDYTFHQPRSRSAIDFFVVSHNAIGAVEKCRVERTWDISDHWPVCTRINTTVDQERAEHNAADENEGFTLVKGSLGSINRKKLGENAGRISTHNRFAALADQIEADLLDVVVDGEQGELVEMRLEDHINRFIVESEKIAKECGVVSSRNVNVNKNGKQRQYWLSKKSQRAVNKRREIAMKLHAAQEDEDTEDAAMVRLTEAYTAAKEKAKTLIKQDRNESWLKFIEAGMEHIKEHDYRLFWRWLKCLNGSGNKSQGSGRVTTPIRDENGEIILDPVEIKEAWARHYGKLCSDDDGLSKDKDKWATEINEDLNDTLPGINEPVSWSEVARVLREIKNGKAAGISGMPAEWLKLAIEEEPMGEIPATPMGKIILSICKRMIEKGVVPGSINRAVVVNIPKKGDPTVMDNYRGISLMEVLLKLACTVVIRRINVGLEKVGALVKEQAGFRTRMECAGQIVSLYEICRRRTLAGKKTYIAFLDFRKAYDSVPHEALLAKMRNIGVRGQAFEFIEAVYANSRLSVRLPCGQTPEVPFLRGSRQGCPMSPILFDIFINDLFETCKELGLGVQVPGVEGRIPGLLFADDSVICASSRKSLQTMLDNVQQWAEKWGMTFGIAKCGAMVVNGDMDKLRQSPPTLQGQVVPVVEEYTYLGMPFNPELNLEKVVKSRVEKVRNALGVMRGFLLARDIPLYAKVTMIRGCLLPIAAYGGELLGMNSTLVQPLQRVVDEALRLAIGVGRTSCSPVVLAKELDVQSVFAATSRTRARCLSKFPNISTWASQLALPPGDKLRTRSRTWSSGAWKWIFSSKNHTLMTAMASTRPGSDRTCGHIALEHCMDRQWNSALKKSVSAQAYERRSAAETRCFVKSAAFETRLAHGVRDLVRLRVGGFLTGYRAAKMGLIDPRYKTHCPCCEENVPETVSHFLLKCPKWADAREAMAQKIPVYVCEALALLDSVDDQVDWLLCGGVHVVTAKCYKAWLKLRDNETVEGTEGNQQQLSAGWKAVAGFLQAVRKERCARLWRTSTLSQRPIGYGMPLHAGDLASFS